MPENNAALSAGDRVGKYQIVALAGAGGMGVVYKALDSKLDRIVALKFLPHDLNASEIDKDRFLKEARTASSLDHPNIGVIHSVEETPDGRSFIVMAFYEGDSLAHRIQRGQMPVSEALDIAIQMARGLEAAHDRHIVHRDIKPSNVLITGQGLVKIVDFGLARVMTSAVSQSAAAGTPFYMSPEQTLGKLVDHRADIWALGVVIAEMLGQQNPFRRDSMPSMIVAILSEPPRLPDTVPLPIQQIIYRALAKETSHRYQNCSDLRADLENVQKGLAPDATEVDMAAVTQPVKSGQFKKYVDRASESAWRVGPIQPTRSKPWLLIAVSLLLLAVISVLLVPSWRDRVSETLAPAEKHIAVLPFDNIGSDPANDPIAQGLMDSLAGKLSDLDVAGKSLWVVPASEVRQRKIDDPTSALRELGATLVVKGEITRNQQAVRIGVNLIDSKKLRQIGSANFEDRAGDLDVLQDEVVARLAKLMHINVTADMLRDTGGSVSPAAYQSYVKALGYIERYDAPGNLDLAIASLNDAVKTDPRFALGYASLGEAYRLKSQLDPNPRWVDEAIANCNRALQLESRLPAVYVTLADLHTKQGKLDLALQEYRQALQLYPRSVTALTGEATTYEKMGRIADAEATFLKAAELRPDYWDGYNSLGVFYDRQGKFPQAIQQYQVAEKLTPDNAMVYSNLGAAYIDGGDPKDFPKAEEALKKAIELNPTYFAYTNLAFVYFDEKRYEDSVAMSLKAIQLNGTDYLVWANLMSAYDALHQKDKADETRQRLIALLEDQLKHNPQDSLKQASLAQLYSHKGERDKALARIHTALAGAPDDPNVLELAGETYENLGDRQQAISFVQKALKKGYPLDQLKDDPQLENLISDPSLHLESK